MMEKYIEILKRQKRLISTEEARELIEISGSEVKERSFKWGRIASAVVVIIAVTIGVLAVLEDEQIEHDYDGYNSIRFASLMQELNANPEVHADKLKLKRAKGIPLDVVAQIVPSEAILRKLGITAILDGYHYQANVKDYGFLSFSIVGSHHSVTAGDSYREEVSTYDFYPLFLTDDKGFQQIRFRFGDEPEAKISDEFFGEATDHLVPITLNAPDGEKSILWFYPSNSFVEILSEGIQISKEEEEHQVLKKQAKIFPNPARDFVNVNVEQKEERVRIQLMNINGELIRELMSWTQIMTSNATYKLDLNDIKEGVYLLSIESSNAPKILKRIIITK